MATKYIKKGETTEEKTAKNDIWDEKKKLINQLYPLPELELWKGKTVESLKANLTTLLDATNKTDIRK